MDEIQHTHVPVRGIKLHVAEIGSGDKVVLFLHGFPEIWYSWRYQMIAVAKAGYRAISIDFRGYGLSVLTSETEVVTFNDMVEDIFALLETLSIPKVFVIGKDWGALTAYHLAVLHPERVVAVVTLGMPFILPGIRVYQFPRLPEGVYLSRWKEPGRAEADFGRFDVKTVIRRIYILFSESELREANEDMEIMDLVDPSTPLPPWFTEDDLNAYATLYEKSGFRAALQVPYRAMEANCGITDPKVESLPVLLIMGLKDYVYNSVGIDEYIKSGKVKEFVPNLEITYIEEGGHFVQEQFPDQVNQLIVSFLNQHCT
ncbi:hypothetical protein Syun_027363 [Stephania yunnanensis]|uniref:AB hydrolase-1 domain-containing protein n=1 Tax=Stephania yunnanensis TaxID=152371 RepID=A0AAP0EIU2_9MAGN